MSNKRRGRSEGSIFQRADGLWTASVSLGYAADGKRKRKTIYGKSKKEAQEKLRKVQTQSDLGMLQDTSKLSVSAYLSLWLDTVARVTVSASTYDRYKLIIDKQVTPYLPAIRLNKLEPFHISTLYGTLEKKGASARTRQMTATVLYGAFKNAVRTKLVAANPCEAVACPKVAKKAMQAYDRQQVKSFLESAAEDRLSALYVTAIETGMRQGELFGLQWPDVDFNTGTIQVQRSLSELRGVFALKGPKTDAGRRRIELSAFTLDALHQHRKRMLADGRDVRAGQMFTDEEGGFLRKSNVTRRSFRSIMERAGLPRIRFHDLRHTAASLLLAAGENVKVVSERLGHEDIEITLKTYAHTLPGMQKGAASKMNDILSGKIGYKLATDSGSVSS